MDETAAADGELMRRAAAGDEFAARTLVERHLPRAFGLAFRMLGNAASADDIAQEAFLRLWKQAGRWRAEARIGTWLYTVVHNLCLDELRRPMRNATALDPELPDSRDTPHAARHRLEVSALVEAELRALPERQRAALALVHYEQVAASEAAAIMGISIEALESLLARARRTLRTRLAALRPDLLGGVQ
jgi:RNA polymerase sigma-70 factor (ECF subfamily)